MLLSGAVGAVATVAGELVASLGLLLFGTFSRSSEGSYLATGAVVTFGASDVRRGEDRDDGAGQLLLLENSRTNLYPDSENISTWAVLGTPVLTGGQTAPDGATDAYIVADDDGAGFEGVRTTAAISELVTYTASYFVLKDNNEARFPEFQHLRAANFAHVQLNTKTGATAIRASSGFTAVSVGAESVGLWWRIWARFTAPAGSGGTLTATINPAASATLGGANVASLTGSIVVWGAQLVAGKIPSSYIRTSGGSATRAADTLTLAVPSSLLTKRWRFTQYSPRHASTDFVSGDQKWLWTLDGSSNGLRLRHNGTDLRIDAVAAGVVKAQSSALSFSKYALLGQVDWDPVNAIIRVGGVAGSAGTAWSWSGSNVRIGGVYGGSGDELDGRLGRLEEV